MLHLTELLACHFWREIVRCKLVCCNEHRSDVHGNVFEQVEAALHCGSNHAETSEHVFGFRVVASSFNGQQFAGQITDGIANLIRSTEYVPLGLGTNPPLS